MGINPAKHKYQLSLQFFWFILPVPVHICSSQHPVDEAEGGVGEADQDGVDDVTHPHWPRTHTEVKEDTETVNSKKEKSS